MKLERVIKLPIGPFYTDFLGFDVAKDVAASGEVDAKKVRKENRGYEDHPFLPSF